MVLIGVVDLKLKIVLSFVCQGASWMALEWDSISAPSPSSPTMGGDPQSSGASGHPHEPSRLRHANEGHRRDPKQFERRLHSASGVVLYVRYQSIRP